MEEKTTGQELSEKLFDKSENAYDVMDDKEIETAYKYADGYKTFMDESKTERECIALSIDMAKKAGFTEFDRTKKYKSGDRVYSLNNGKAAFFFIFGKKKVSDGIHMAGSHIDSPRLDLKPSPVIEERELCMLKTHYYGGLRKYQWTTIPLALHGVVCKKDGSSVKVSVGENEDEPVLILTDLLPHLAAEQSAQKLSEAIKGENMNILVGSQPFKDDKASERVKLNILNILNKKYGITEKDFLTAELEIVPAAKARDVGLDASFIGAYGHDDKVCAYPALTALLDVKTPEHGVMCMLVDKEETGSDGLTGMQSNFMQYFIEELTECDGGSYRDTYRNSVCLSADVTAAYDPNYPEVMDIHNCAFLNHGICISKYHGSRGKYGTNDASAELVAYITGIFDDSNSMWQSGEMGKVDQGGGGTISKYVAQLGIRTLDVGVAMLCMHAPWEIVTKLDLYSAYKAFSAFYNK